jgi:PhnB protein
MEPFEGVKGVSLSVNCTEVAEGERLFKALAAGGSVKMPFAASFWSPGFGMLVDQFGVPWMVNVDQLPTG